MKKLRTLGNRSDIGLCGPVTINQKGHLVFGAFTGMLRDGHKEVRYFSTGTSDLAQALIVGEQFLDKLREQWDRARARAGGRQDQPSADEPSEPGASPSPSPGDQEGPPLPKLKDRTPLKFVLCPEFRLWLEKHRPRSADVWIFPELLFSSGAKGPETQT